MKKLFVILGLFLCLNMYAQTITIDKSKLEQIIQTEVSKAVDEAVAIAVKDVENKYTLIIADKDKKIVDLEGQINKKDIDIKSRDITIQNDAITFSNYKKDHGIKRDFLIGGLSLGAGFILNGIIQIIIKY